MTSKTKKIIILGHSGFIGSRLVRLLSESASYKIIGCSLPDVDLCNSSSATLLAPHFSPDSTIVLAAAIKRQFGDTLEAYQQNMAIVENVCRLLEAHPVKRIIYLSSAAVYGEETENTSISEQTPINPTSYYGIAKYTGERLLKKESAANQNTSLVCLRPSLIYGPGDQGRTYGPSGFCSAALEGTPITLWGDGKEMREFVFIDDICRVIERVITTEFEGELNVVSGTRYCFEDVITALKSRFPNLMVHSRQRSKPKANNAFDASKIKSLLPSDFRFTGLEEGLTRMLNQNHPSK
ncbi:MAG: SDR family oxidoreductase [Bacteroidia bacterium]|nr:SDR family oxidoreductase [Bacteroidia bacterium]